MPASKRPESDDSEVLALSQEGAEVYPDIHVMGCDHVDETKPQAPMSSTASLKELHFEIERLNSEYAHVLDNERYEEFPELFVEDCHYRVVPRENHLLGR